MSHAVHNGIKFQPDANRKTQSMPSRRGIVKSSPSSVKSVGFKQTDYWRSSKTLSQSNAAMLRHGVLADVTFSVGLGKTREKIRAHKYILVSRSPVFFAMFTEKECNVTDDIVVDDVEPELFHKLLSYMYTDVADVSTRTVTALLHGARKFALYGLEERCCRYLLEGINVDTVCTLLEQAHRFSQYELQDNCLRFIFKNAHTVLRTPGFRKLCKVCLAKVIESDELRADEAKVYEAVCSWSERACKREKLPITGDNRARVLGKIKYLIRFPLMDVEYFTNIVSQTDQSLLSKDETFAVFQYLHSRSSPNVESFITRRRCITRAVRFDTTSGAWNVGNYCCDAIQFQCSNTVTLDGISVYGCFKGEAGYDVSIRVLDFRHQLLVKTDTAIHTNEYSDTYDVMLINGIKLKALTWYTIVLYMEGHRPNVGCVVEQWYIAKSCSFSLKLVYLLRIARPSGKGKFQHSYFIKFIQQYSL